jgi:AraC-like DNA-binding protein
MDTLSLILDDIRLHGVAIAEYIGLAPWRVHLHTPGVAAFHVVTGGRAWLTRQGAPPLCVGPGELVVLPGGIEHYMQDDPIDRGPLAQLVTSGHLATMVPQRIGGSGPQTYLLSGHFRFEADLARPLTSALPEVMHVRAAAREPPLWLQLGLQFFANERGAARPAQQAIINRIAEIMLIECLREYVEALPEGSGNWLLALRDAALSAALSAMHRHPEREWTVPELAEIACLSRSAFAERFAQVVGQPPLSYLTRHRMRLAAWRLSHTSQSIRAIAEQVGYSSETAFSQAFKREHGCAPSSLRRQARRSSPAGDAPAPEAGQAGASALDAADRPPP